MNNPFISDHPFISHQITVMRDADTNSADFGRSMARVTRMLVYEAIRDLETEQKDIRTPLTNTKGSFIKDKVALVPVLRAGLGMSNAASELLEDASIRHLGMYRDEKTLEPVAYYNKLPTNSPPDVALVLDPMLATGGTLLAVVETLRKWGVERIKIISIIASPEGVKRVMDSYPDTEIFLGALDERLTKDDPVWPDGFIWPGLGDAGDRLNGTVEP